MLIFPYHISGGRTRPVFTEWNALHETSCFDNTELIILENLLFFGQYIFLDSWFLSGKVHRVE